MRRLLQLQHHRHTGKLLHHRHTSYRALAVILIFTGVVLGWAGWSMRQIAQADSLLVTAKVPAPIPSSAAVITSPEDGTVVQEAPITVIGTCPVITPAIAVAIYDNGRLLGSAPCLADGSFEVQGNLGVGMNELLPRTVTVTDDNGPDGIPVHITYSPPLPPPTAAPPLSPSSGTSSTAPPSNRVTTPEAGTSSPPLVIQSDKSCIIFGPREPAVWKGSITGGNPPYRVTVNWGDGYTETFLKIAPGERVFRHTYKVMIAYTIHVTAVDTEHASATATFAAITFYVPQAIGSIFGNPYGGPSIFTYLAIYAAYLVCLCVFGVIWLRSHPAPAYAKVHIFSKHSPPVRRRRHL